MLPHCIHREARIFHLFSIHNDETQNFVRAYKVTKDNFDLYTAMDNSGTYILAVNACAQKVKARFDLRDFCLPSAYAKVAWEKRRLKLDRGLLVDDFPPFGVHVYRFDPEKGRKRK